jgi:hypothetical protein
MEKINPASYLSAFFAKGYDGLMTGARPGFFNVIPEVTINNYSLFRWKVKVTTILYKIQQLPFYGR